METLIRSCKGDEKCKEIIVVDNASTDRSIQIFEEFSMKVTKPPIRVIRLKRNNGFCYAVNLGIALASSELVAILNPDVYVDDNWLHPILKDFEASPRIGIVQPLIYWYQCPERVQSAGLYADVIGNYKANNGIEIKKAILAPFGAAYVVRRCSFMRIGGLDSVYFMYGDELDLGLRMWLAGWMVVLEPKSRVYHYMGGVTPSSAYYKYLKHFLMRHNQMITLMKSLSLKHLFMVLPLLISVNIIRGTRSKESFRAILSAYVDVARKLRYVIAKRNRYSKIKVLSEDKLRCWGLLRPLARK
jgi:GT2 family glycosyltransferase